MRIIDLIVIHCSASDRPEHDNVETIKKWHKERGFTDIGYHYVITKNGSLFLGRPEWQIGSHVKGFNKNSIGICLTGLDEFSQEQKARLEILLKNLCMQYNLSKNDIVGHHDLNPNKSCPNFDVHEYLSKLNWH